MGRLRKASHRDVPLASSLESADSIGEPFVPNDFAEDGSCPMSTDLSADDGGFDKALLKFYLNQKVKCLKRKLSSASRRNVRQKRSSDFPSCATFTRYSGKFFSGVVDGLVPRYRDVIETYGMGCLLHFVRTEVPLRLVKWLASRFDVLSSEFQCKNKFIPVTKDDIHDILDLPVDGEPLVCDTESGRDFILSHFNLTSIPPVSYFANKLKSTELELSDDDIFICFMIVAFSSFLCPNSRLSPSPKYLHIFHDCRSVCNYDLSRFVYEWLLSNIKKFKDSTKVASKRSVTFGGCHYAFAVCYLDQLNFGLHSTPDVKPRLLAWRGNKVKQFSELDRNNSRSYGKRPLKRLCHSANLQHSTEKSSASKDGDVPHFISTPFAVNVQKCLGARFSFETAQVVIHLVQARNKDKPKLFVEWSESLVIDVLDCLAHVTFNANSATTPKVCSSEAQSLNKFSFGNKSVSIQSIIPNTIFGKAVDIPSTEVQQEIPNVNEETPSIPGVVIDGGFHNPVILSSSSAGAKVCDESMVTEANVRVAVPMAPFYLGTSSSHAIGSSPSITPCAIPAVGSSFMNSGGPFKKCDPKVDVSVFQTPSVAELNHNLGDKSAGAVAIDQHIGIDSNCVKEDNTSFRGLSPLLGDVQCSQYAVERCMNPFDPHVDEDCVEMVRVPQTEVSKSTFSSSRRSVQLCSPASFKVTEPEDDIQIVGTTTFADRCQELSRSNDAAYNKLNNLKVTQSKNCKPKKLKVVPISPEVEILSSRSAPRSCAPVPAPAVVPKVVAQTFNFPSGSSGGHAPRRMVVPGRYNSDPYVAPGNRFPVTNLERRHHHAMVQIESHETWCKYEAIRYDRAYCSYRNLATMKSNEHVDNFLILCVCRYLFKQSHPSVSKKRFFFSYIGETILSETNVEIVSNAFAGATSAFPIWRSNLLYFPIARENHWFSFVVCLKERVFAFLDSLYGPNSEFHQEIRDTLVENFQIIWHQFVTPVMNKRIDFEIFDIVYHTVPQQDNHDDCGVFTWMYMKHWTPRTPISNMFGPADIDNIRIRLANELYFSTHNSCDQSFVTDFFGDAKA